MNSRKPRPRPEHSAYDSAERARVEAVDKQVATLRAKAALAGWRIEVVATGFECSRWSRYRTFPTLDQAERFIAEVAP